MNYYNVTARILTILVKTLFLFFLAKNFNPEAIGQYSLFQLSIFYLIIVSSGELQWFTARMYKSEPDKDLVISTHIFLVSSYIVFFAFPLFYIAIVLNYLPSNLILLTFLLLVVEIFLQQIHYYLIIAHKSTYANIILFFRQGFWALLILLYYYVLGNRDVDLIDEIIKFWLIVDLLTTVVILYKFNIELRLIFKKINLKKINFLFIKKAILSSVLMFLLIIIVLSIDSGWKILIENYVSISMLGVFSIYLSIAQATESLITGGIIQTIYPKLNHAYFNDKNLYDKYMKILLKKILIYSSILLILSIPTSIILFGYLGKPIYVDNLYLLYFILLSVYFKLIEQVYNYDLIISGNEVKILMSNLLSVLLLMPFIYIFNSLELMNLIIYSYLLFSFYRLIIKIIFSRSSDA